MGAAIREARGWQRGKPPSAIALPDLLQIGAPKIGRDAAQDLAVFPKIDIDRVGRPLQIHGPAVDQIGPEPVKVALQPGPRQRRRPWHRVPCLRILGLG
jgi:hypothetical protein